jgi:hypothetical protein
MPTDTGGQGQRDTGGARLTDKRTQKYKTDTVGPGQTYRQAGLDVLTDGARQTYTDGT